MNIQPRGPRKIFHAWYTDPAGRRRSKSTKTANRREAELIRARWETQAREAHADPEQYRARLEEARPLAEHVAEYVAHLEAGQKSPHHVRQVAAILGKFCALTGAGRVGDLTLARVDRLTNHHLNKGNCPRTVNHALSILKAFSAWLDRSGKTRLDPLRHARKLNAATDTRRARRAMSGDELAWLAHHTRALGNDRANLPGPKRAALYLLAACSGLRAGELRSLTPAAFDLGDEPSATVKAAYAKNRKEARQPLAPDVAEALRLIVCATAEGEPVFYGLHKQARMLRDDMLAAREAWIRAGQDYAEKSARTASDFLKPKDAQGKVVDFHALRHTFITGLRRAGVDIKTAQLLARHSDAKLTLAIYSHAIPEEVRKAAPGLPPSPKEVPP